MFGLSSGPVGLPFQSNEPQPIWLFDSDPACTVHLAVNPEKLRSGICVYAVSLWLGYVLFGPSLVLGQTLSPGQYFGSSYGQVTTLSLYDDGSFFITVSDGEAGVAGRGEWRAKTDSLRLRFTRPFHFDFPRWTVVERTRADTTRITVVALFGPNGMKLPGSSVYPVPHTTGYGTITNVLGTAELVLPNDLDVEYVEVESVLQMPVRIPYSELQGRQSIVKAYLYPITHEFDFSCSHCQPLDPDKRYETVFHLTSLLNGRIALTNGAFSIKLEKRQ